MVIDITDPEREELKTRVLANVEHRLTEELLQQMRREVTRETLTGVYKSAKEQLGKLVVGKITDDMVQAEIQRALKEMANPNPYGNRSIFRDAIDKALLRVVEETGKIVGKEVTNLMYEALRRRLEPEQK